MHIAHMCGRFNVIDNPGLQELLRELGLDLALPSRANIAPTESVALVRERGGRRTVDTARWWLTPSWAPAVEQKYAMFNARSEGLAESRAYRQPFRCQRGLVPMSSFIEWCTEPSGKTPWKITSESNALAVAALWDVWQKGEGEHLSCTIVTGAAPESFRPWHSRTPIVLVESEWDRWLDNGREVSPDDGIFAPLIKQPLILQRLPTIVGNAREKDVRHMAGVGDEVVLPADNRACC